MSRLTAGRFQIEFTLLELDDDGEPVAEYVQQPVGLVGFVAVQAFLDDLRERIAAKERELLAHGNGNPLDQPVDPLDLPLNDPQA